MGAESTSIGFERLPSSAVGDVQELAAATWERFCEWFRAAAPGEWDHVSYYAEETSHEVLPSWVGTDRIDFVFRHNAGACGTSAALVVHWIEVFHALRAAELNAEIAEPRGFRFAAAEVPAFAIARNMVHPFVWVGAYPYELETLSVGQRIGDRDWYYGIDGGTPTPPFRELSPADRHLVQRTRITGQCRCGACEIVRGPFTALAALAEREADLVRAFTLLELDDVAKALLAAARPAVRAFSDASFRANPKGPPELVALANHLATRGLRPTSYALSGLASS